MLVRWSGDGWIHGGGGSVVYVSTTNEAYMFILHVNRMTAYVALLPRKLTCTTSQPCRSDSIAKA
jgi:hypothetical protein